MSGHDEGASIAVNGVCLTAVDCAPTASPPTSRPRRCAARNLGDLRPGSRVNLERPLSPTGRLSGHIVRASGRHRRIPVARALGDDNWWLRIRVPDELDPFLVYKGSIAIDGISLTIAVARSRVLA